MRKWGSRWGTADHEKRARGPGGGVRGCRNREELPQSREDGQGQWSRAGFALRSRGTRMRRAWSLIVARDGEWGLGLPSAAPERSGPLRCLHLAGSGRPCRRRTRLQVQLFPVPHDRRAKPALATRPSPVPGRFPVSHTTQTPPRAPRERRERFSVAPFPISPLDLPGESAQEHGRGSEDLA
jgi:hypothetical protein